MTEPSSTPSRYALFGTTPAEVYAPRSPEDAQEIVRQSPGKALVPWGGGTRQDFGYAPERYDGVVLTGAWDKITDYEPADLTVTAQAGMTVAALQHILAEHGQCLPLDIARPDAQTLGGVVAARAGSVSRFGRGSVRDLLLGVSVINSRGEKIKGGGKVVKNVAGYDLPKLYCGSLGTLGLITEISFKVAPLPEASATALLPLDAGHNSEDVLDGLLGSDLTPSFVWLLSPQAAAAVLPGAGDAQLLCLGFDGDGESVDWQVQTLGAGALDDAAAKDARAALRDFSLSDSPLTAEFHVLSSQVGAFSRMLEWTARRAGFRAAVASDAALGLMTAHFTPETDASDWHVFYADLKDKADRCGGSFVLSRMPETLRAAGVPVWSPLLPDFGLMARVKAALDPARLWNPGRFVGRL